MGIGREVADAYIDVHGDLTNFRKDLEGADNLARQAALKNADAFSDAWAKRIDSDVQGKWGSIVNAMYSENQIDWDKMLGDFNPRSLDDAREKVREFLHEMRDTVHEIKDAEGEVIESGFKLDTEQYDQMLDRLDDVLEGMQKREDHQRRLIGLEQELIAMQDRNARIMKVRAADEEEARRDDAAWNRQRQAMIEDAYRMNQMWMDRRKKTMDEAIAQNKAWARTFDGISKNDAIKNLNEDFTKLTKAMTDADIAKWGNRLEGDFQRMAQRVREVSAAMLDQRRISDEDALAMVNRVDAFIKAENEKSKAMRDALDETNRLKDAQDEYNKSLRGMAQAFHSADMETKFKQLATAIESNDWSGMARGAKNMEELRDRTMETATEMHRLGRMSDAELTMVGDRINAVSKNMTAANVQFKQATNNANVFATAMTNVGNAITRTGNLFTRLNNVTRGFREHIQGFAGLNVFGDMIQKGLDFVRNLDRIALGLGKNTLLMGSMAAVGASAFAGLITVAADLGGVLGGLAVALPAFVVGAGIGIGVLTAAMKDMDKVLADLKPAFEELQNQISSSFWTAAAGPIRDMVKTLMPILTPKLKGTATALGGLVGKLATAFKDIPADKINGMFDRMNEAIEILGGAMGPLVRAFTTLGEVGSKYFTRFSTWLVTLSNQFDAFIQKSAANGDLDRWINNMIEGFKNIGRAIDGAMGIFNALNDAAERAGFGGLKTFADALQDAAAIMQTAEFQTTLTTYLEGARDLAIKLGTAIKDLGPAFESFAPTAKTVLGDIGDAVQTLIGYIGDIFTNPTFQQGVKDFTASLDEAVKKLQPAIKPFGDSLGTALSLLGDIAVAVAEVATAFFVHLSPVLDTMSEKFRTLIDPLKNTVINFIKEMEGPLRALDEQFIGPLVKAFNDKLLPAINGFIDEFGPFAEKVIKDLGPAFKVLVDTVLPNFVRLAGELLTPLGDLIALLSPLFAGTLEKIGTAMGNLADAIKVLKGELPITDLWIFKAMDPAKIQADAEAARKIVEENMSGRGGTSDWGQVLADLFLGARPDVFWSRVWSLIGPSDAGAAKWDASVGMWLEAIRVKLVNDWNAIWSGQADREWTDKMIEWFPNQADFLNGVQGWTDDVFSGKWFGEAKTNIENMWNDTWKEGGNADQLNKTVNDWLKTNIGDPFTGAMDAFGKSIPDSFKNDVEEWGLIPAIGNHFNNVVFPAIGKAFEDGWRDIQNADYGSQIANTWEGFWRGWDGFWKDDAAIGADIDTFIRNWWDTNVVKPLTKTFDDAWKNVAEGRWGSSVDGAAKWDGFWKSFGDFFRNSGTETESLNETVNNWLNTNVWEPIGKWFEELDWAQIGTDLWNGFIEGLTGSTPAEWEKVTQGFTGWIEDIRTFFGIHSPSTLMFSIAGDIVAGFLNGFGDFATKVAEKWEEIKTAVTTKFEELKAGLAEKWEEFKIGWGEFWGGLGTTIATKWEEFKTTVSTKWTELTTGLSEKWAEFQLGWDTFWTGFGTILGTKWEEFKTTVSTKWTELTTNLSLAWEGFSTGWTEFWGGVGTTLGTKWEEFKTTVSTKFEELKTGAATAWEGFKTNWSTFWTDTGQTLSTKWEEFKGTVGKKAGEIKTGVDTWAGDVKRGWDGFWGGVGETLGTKWGEFTKTTSTKAGEIKTNVSNFGRDVKTNWDTFWGGVGTTLTNKWGEFTGTTGRKAGEIKTNVSNMATDVTSKASAAWSAMSRDISNSFQNFVNVVRNRIGDMVSWVSGLPGRISGALSGLGNLLWVHGSNIMVGFFNGLISMWSQVQSFVGGIASWIAANKGPLSYDRVLLQPAGEAIMGGLDKGIRNGMDPLLNTLQAITAAVSDTVTADLSKSVMYATGKDAAQGLADGLKANRSAVHTAIGNLGAFTVPSSQITVGSVGSVGRPTIESAPGRSVTIAEGAIKIETPTKSPELVAAKLIDSFVNYSTF